MVESEMRANDYSPLRGQMQNAGKNQRNTGGHKARPYGENTKFKIMVKGKKLKVKNNYYIIGVDGGGTKTACALADMEGKIITRALVGSVKPRNIGITATAKNLADGIYGVLKSKTNIKIVSTFIGIPDVEEEYKNKKVTIIKELKKHKKIAKIFNGKVNIGSDQLVAFRSGANGKDGIVAIAGTGSATHGWNSGKEVLVNNQGWVSKGAAEWIGSKIMQAIAESLDGRGEKTILVDLVFKKYKFNDIDKLLEFFYKDSKSDLPKLAILCDKAAIGGDKVAREILIRAGKEIALSVRAAAATLGFFEQVPLVLVGGVYKSRWVADTAMNEIERYYPGKFDFVVVGDPVAGAVKLAIENAKCKNQN
jgi:N-acetylglucosamine kinase